MVPDLKLMAVLARPRSQEHGQPRSAASPRPWAGGITLLPFDVAPRRPDGAAGPNTDGGLPRRIRDIEYGQEIARTLTVLDLGQTVVVKDRAAVALEAMEGTDEVIRRAGRIAGAGCMAA